MAVLHFVHGVATRQSPEYDVAVAARGRRFRSTAFDGVPLEIIDTYWGAFGAGPQWDLACIPDVRKEFEHLGLDDEEILSIDGKEPLTDRIVYAAKADFAGTVAALSIENLAALEAEGDEDALIEAERFWAAAASYAERDTAPGWLDSASDDEEFVAKLRENVEALASTTDLGFLDPIGGAVRRLGGAMSNLVNKPFARIGRERISPVVAIFIGDVFRYLREAEPREEIRQAVLADLTTAAKAAQSSSTPLVVIGHSMGGIILYDLLSHEAAMKAVDAQLDKPLAVDLLLTVGSQVALFEELKLFTSSDPARRGEAPKPMDRAPKPGRAEIWWNAFDRMDVLSFIAQPVFSDVVDLEVDTIAGVKSAHTAYFTNMVFYQRLNARLREIGIVA